MAKRGRRATRLPRPMILGMRGTGEWRDWLDGLADHCRIARTQVIDLALVDYAKKVGYPPPPRR